MIKRFAISIFNSFFYLGFLIYLIILTSKYSNIKDTESIIVTCCFLLFCLIPVFRFFINLKNNRVFNSYISLTDILNKFIPLFLILLSFILYEYQKLIFVITAFYGIVMIFCYMFMSIVLSSAVVIFKFIESSFTFDLYGYDWNEFKNTLELFTSNSYLIYDCEESKDGVFCIYSSDKTYHFNYKENYFIMNDNVITKNTILQFQEDYKKKFFDMSPSELEVITMWSV